MFYVYYIAVFTKFQCNTFCNTRCLYFIVLELFKVYYFVYYICDIGIAHFFVEKYVVITVNNGHENPFRANVFSDN